MGPDTSVYTNSTQTLMALAEVGTDWKLLSAQSPHNEKTFQTY